MMLNPYVTRALIAYLAEGAKKIPTRNSFCAYRHGKHIVCLMDNKRKLASYVFSDDGGMENIRSIAFLGMNLRDYDKSVQNAEFDFTNQEIDAMLS